MTTPIILRSSAVSAFKACPARFRYKYIEGLIPEGEKEATRMGTSWHGLLETYRNIEREAVDRLTREIDQGGGDDMIPERAAEEAKDGAFEYLEDRYKDCPAGVEPEKWTREYIILLYSFIGYLWYWQNDEVETLATEVGFDLPLHHPKTGLPLRTDEVVRHGTIDRIVRRNGTIQVADYKSTASPIDADSQFWAHLRLDTQISMYVMALQELHSQGELRKYGIADDEVVAGAFYDVWHKPRTKPKNLTQKDTLALIDTGEYCGITFVVEHAEPSEAVPMRVVKVDGDIADVEEGKRGFAIRETPRMFGARLLKDIQENPGAFFARREIPRTRADIKKFREQLYAVYQMMKFARDGGHWPENERQCEATFHCPYIPICYNNIDVSDGQTPEGMVREDVNLTVEGHEI